VDVLTRSEDPKDPARVVEAIQQRLTLVLETAEQVLEKYPNQSTLRVF